MVMLHTGEHALRNPLLVDAIKLSLASGVSVQETAAVCKVGPQTVQIVRDTAPTDPQQLVSWKDAMMKSYERVMAKCINRYEQAVDNDEVKPSTLPLGLGIIGTKRLELLAEVSTGHAPSPSLDPSTLIEELSESVPASIPLNATTL